MLKITNKIGNYSGHLHWALGPMDKGHQLTFQAVSDENARKGALRREAWLG
jgi:hypothetical protein